MEAADSPEALRQELRAWLQANPPEGYDHATFTTLDYHARFELRRSWQQQLHAAGWIGLDWPVKYGGRGTSRLEETICRIELNSIDSPQIANEVALAVAGPAIMHFGTDEQRERYLPAMLAVTEVWSQGFSEPDAGSDLAAMRTSAVIEGESIVLNGSKVWTTLAPKADFCMVLARTDMHAPKHRGLSAIIVDMRSEGIRLEPIVQITGDSDFCQIYFDDVVVPRQNVVGELGAGWQIAMTTLTCERQTVMYEYMVDQVLRQLLDAWRTLADHGLPCGVVRDQLARFYTEARVVRWWSEQQLDAQIRRGEEMGPEASIGKLMSSRLAQEMSEYAMNVVGARSLLTSKNEDAVSGGAWARLLSHTRYYTIASGTSEIQRNILAERVLGLPREP